MAYLRPHAVDGVVDDIAGVPRIAAAANVVDEARIDAVALRSVRYFGVELQAVVVPRFVGDARDGQVRRGGNNLEARRRFDDAIAMAHPHIQQAMAFGVHAVFNIAQQRGMATRANFGVAELLGVMRFHAPAQLVRHGLQAVADAEHRNAQFPHCRRRTGRAFFRDRFRATRKDDALRREGANLGVCHVPGVQFAVHAQLAHAARYELGVLRPEVQDEQAVGMNVGHGRVLSRYGSSGLPS